ncbi:hypothetical protein ES703_83057 [subsurface metagenome]
MSESHMGEWKNESLKAYIFIRIYQYDCVERKNKNQPVWQIN